MAWLSIVIVGLAVGCGSNAMPGGKRGGVLGSTGGAGGAGTADGGSDGGSDAALCASLSAAYDQALTAALACNPTADGQCAVLALYSLKFVECGQNCYDSYVNDATALDQIKQQWLAAGCGVPVSCITTLCLPPFSGECVAVDGGLGVCSTTSEVH
jgi:hypothetical protein